MKSIKLFNIISIFICILITATGCGKKSNVEETPIATVILIGNHANSQCFDIKLEATIQKTYTSFGNMGIIIVDGNPSLMRDDDSVEILGCYSAEYQKKSKQMYKDNDYIWARDYLFPQVDKITTALNTCKADDPEVDTLSALFTAVESLNTIENSMGVNTEKEIVIVDTGLCTSGPLNFCDSEYQKLLNYEGKIWENDIISSKVSDLVEQLDKKAELPKLKEIKVTWYGLGQVSEPQPSLSSLKLQNLQYIWGEVLTKAGCLQSTEANVDERYGIFVPTSAFGGIECEQYVTPIQWEREPKRKLETTKALELPLQKIIFRSNKDEYLQPEEEIEDILYPYISPLQDCSDKMLLLVGTTSSWRGGSQKLSEDRAKRVKKTMIMLGISEDCICTIGLGYNPNICQNDSPDGQFEESIAQENRAVLILPYDSPEAQELLRNIG
ncbi:hypothetical protein AALB47_20995 [Lachnospiraceae bacterium 54-11]